IGIPNCIIFRPERDVVSAGKRYVVEIKGIRRANGEQSPPFRYPVEFVRLGTVPGLGKPSEGPPDGFPPLSKGKAYASIRNETGGPVRLAMTKGARSLLLAAGGTLNVLAPLPPQGKTVYLLPRDATGTPTPILLRNGERYVIRTEGKGYELKKRPAET